MDVFHRAMFALDCGGVYDSDSVHRKLNSCKPIRGSVCLLFLLEIINKNYVRRCGTRSKSNRHFVFILFFFYGHLNVDRKCHAMMN